MSIITFLMIKSKYYTHDITNLIIYFSFRINIDFTLSINFNINFSYKL